MESTERVEPWWDEACGHQRRCASADASRDYPRGAYWSAERRDRAEEDQPAAFSVSGSVLRMMWDYGVRVPLWDADGLLPEEADWLRQALGLSDALIEDLTCWSGDMEGLDAVPSRRTSDAYDALDTRARDW